MSLVISGIAQWFVPVLILLVLGFAHWRRVKVFEAFTEGAKESLSVASAIFPFLLAMLVAIAVLRASGLLALVAGLCGTILTPLGIPAEVLPMALMRPISGSGSLGVLTDLFKQYGPDSLIGRIASTMQGSTETTIYVLAVYFGSVGISNYRHALVVGLVADLAAFLAAVWVCKLIF